MAKLLSLTFLFVAGCATPQAPQPVNQNTDYVPNPHITPLPTDWLED